MLGSHKKIKFLMYLNILVVVLLTSSIGLTDSGSNLCEPYLKSNKIKSETGLKNNILILPILDQELNLAVYSNDLVSRNISSRNVIPLFSYKYKTLKSKFINRLLLRFLDDQKSLTEKEIWYILYYLIFKGKDIREYEVNIALVLLLSNPYSEKSDRFFKASIYFYILASELADNEFDKSYYSRIAYQAEDQLFNLN